MQINSQTCIEGGELECDVCKQNRSKDENNKCLCNIRYYEDV